MMGRNSKGEDEGKLSSCGSELALENGPHWYSYCNEGKEARKQVAFLCCKPPLDSCRY
jgi:hypothetical protein